MATWDPTQICDIDADIVAESYDDGYSLTKE